YHARKAFDKAAGGIIANQIDQVMRVIGITDAESLARVSEGLKNGSISPRQWEQYGQQINALKARTKAELIAAAQQHGIIANWKGGRKEFNKALDSNLSMFDDIRELIYNQQTGTLTSVQRDHKAMLDEDKRDLVRSPLLG